MESQELEVTLGRNVRSLRIAKRLTQSDLAELANVSVGALKSLERAKGSSLATLVKVLHALGNDTWVAQLAPSTTFNPLALVEHRRDARRSKTPSRVRRRATP
jgi:transcriptional regulator with XRE-family HTH domain